MHIERQYKRKEKQDAITPLDLHIANWSLLLFENSLFNIYINVLLKCTDGVSFNFILSAAKKLY